MNNDLEECPFCGSGDVGGASGIINCYVCRIETKKYSTTAIAAAAWNRRAESAELATLRAERDALREQRRNEEPQAWLHTMHMEGDQTYEKLTFDEENAFGSPGKDYSEDYRVTIEPLYLHSAALDRIDKLGEQDG